MPHAESHRGRLTAQTERVALNDFLLRPLIQLYAAATLMVLAAAPARAQACPPDTPPDCSVSSQFPAGRMALGALVGSYEMSGTELFPPWAAGSGYEYNYDISGSLDVELIGGPASNYIDVACDGTITGQGMDRISGIIDKSPASGGCRGFGGGTGAMDMHVVVDRTYTITGQVTGAGEVELDLAIDSATLSLEPGTTFSEYEDCEHTDWDAEIAGIDVTGTNAIEKLRLSDPSFNPLEPNNWTPEVTSLDPLSWFEDIGERLSLNAYYDYVDGDKVGIFGDPRLLAVGESPDPDSYHATLAQTTVAATLEADVQGDPKAPAITQMTLDEPSAFLEGVTVDTSLTVTVDWREADAPHQIEFTYGSTTETVPAGGDDTTWTFDAAESATSITAKAISASGDSQPWEIAAPKVEVPGWGGTSSDWSGSAGVRYDATLDWPISMQTTQTIDSLPLVSGLWGVDGSAMSEYGASARSNGSPTSGAFDTSASLKLAGQGFDFEMRGDTSTTLSCDELITSGSADASLTGLRWEKTLNPVTAIPGLGAAVCGLSGLLCDLVNSIGPEGEVSLDLNGSGQFSDDGSDITWDGGTLTGTLDARITASPIPKFARGIADLGIEGGGSGCMDFSFQPDFQLDRVGGEIHVGAFASFLGLSVNPSHDWPFGGGCSRGSVGVPEDGGRGAGAFVPADGQLAMAVSSSWGAAVWSEVPAGSSRPSGNLHLRLWDGDAWQPTVALTAGTEAHSAPAAEFDGAGQLLVVHQHSVAVAPTQSSEFDAYADTLELVYTVVDPATGTVTSQGVLTSNVASDYGAVLVRDGIGGLHLFWARGVGAEIFGTTGRPLTLLMRSWDELLQSWGAEEVVASGLAGLLGWSAAADSASEMVVSLLLDTDVDLTDAADREIFAVERSDGSWQLPQQITSDNVADTAPIVGFDTSGPVLLWQRDGAVWQHRGAVSSEAIVVGSLSPAGAMGIRLNDGQLVRSDEGLAALWPESARLVTSREHDDGTSVGWIQPATWQVSAAAQTVHAARVVGNDLLVGRAERAFAPGGESLEAALLPVIERRVLLEAVFADGFEEGGTAAWSLAIP